MIGQQSMLRLAAINPGCVRLHRSKDGGAKNNECQQAGDERAQEDGCDVGD